MQRCKKYASKQRKKENNHVCEHNWALALVAILMASLPFGEQEWLSAPFCHLIK